METIAIAMIAIHASASQNAASSGMTVAFRMRGARSAWRTSARTIERVPPRVWRQLDTLERGIEGRDRVG